MNKLIIAFWMLIVVVFPTRSSAQYNPKEVCRFENDRIIFKLDNRWTVGQREEVRKLFDLDSQLMKAAYSGSREILLDGVNWQIRKIDAHLTEVSKELNPTPAKHVSSKDVFLYENSTADLDQIRRQTQASFGVNNFKINKLFTYKDNKAGFYLDGYPNARKVVLSGTFNNWSTVQLPMHQTSTGWYLSIRLQPGKHQYKFIIDGRWTEDPNNILKENDLAGGHNSVVYCNNYQFTLKGYHSAKKVMLAGSFNDWKSNQYRMYPTAEGWTLPVYLKDGTYAYKFVVDNKWVTDPSNPTTRVDEGGNFNSIIAIGQSHLFRLKGFRNAKEVRLAGNFNNWNPNELALTRGPEEWQLAYVLAPGLYEYKFIVDGTWMTDPANPFTIGGGSTINSVLAFRPNHTFTLAKYLTAKRVLVTGDFSNWRTDGYQMVKKNGVWTFPIYLSPGKHLYKFIVDGKWILDPNNRLWEPNQVGSNNSFFWIEP